MSGVKKECRSRHIVIWNNMEFSIQGNALDPLQRDKIVNIHEILNQYEQVGEEGYQLSGLGCNTD